MNRVKPVVVLAAFAALALGATFALSGPASSPEAGDLAALRGSGMLDGMAFTSRLGPVGEPPDVDDLLIFSDGLFLSAECERRCNFPARPYFARERDDRIEFISETRCPGKDATLVWRGVVEDGVVKGEFTWTSSRWYWTHEKQFAFEGVLSEKTASLDGR